LKSKTCKGIELHELAERTKSGKLTQLSPLGLHK